MRCVLVVGLLGACASSNVDIVGGADAAQPADGPKPGPDPGVQRYIGQLTMTATVPFGGTPYCSYSMTLKAVTFDVTVHPTGGLTTMSVTDMTNEAIVGTCPYAPAAATLQGFAHEGGPTLPDANGSFKPVIDGLATNQPMTALTVVVQPMTDASINVTARWQRTDQVPTLTWVITTPAAVPLARVPCEVNGIYCLGDRAVGSLYGCTDGIHLTAIKHCSAGCMPPSQGGGPHVNETCN